jgi:predicted RNA binding protein YcfA (HicA-like mRNA interferase family)
MNRHKLLRKILTSPNNIQFTEMVNLLAGFGFVLSRTSGSHHIFECPGVPELVNIQNVKGQAKPYQIRQFLKLVEKHNLQLEEE